MLTSQVVLYLTPGGRRLKIPFKKRTTKGCEPTVIVPKVSMVDNAHLAVLMAL